MGSPAHAGIGTGGKLMGSPAHAGIDRDTGRNRRQANGFPRPRGPAKSLVRWPVPGQR